jgi:hypothetical protein
MKSDLHLTADVSYSDALVRDGHDPDSQPLQLRVQPDVLRVRLQVTEIDRIVESQTN